jgi:hypothetical protein
VIVAIIMSPASPPVPPELLPALPELVPAPPELLLVPPAPSPAPASLPALLDDDEQAATSAPVHITTGKM